MFVAAYLLISPRVKPRSVVLGRAPCNSHLIAGTVVDAASAGGALACHRRKLSGDRTPVGMLLLAHSHRKVELHVTTAVGLGTNLLITVPCGREGATERS